MRVVQVTPTSFSAAGVIGGGERLAIYLDRALRLADPAVDATLVALDAGATRGTAWQPGTVDAAALIEALRPADAVYVHQCLSAAGLYAASHARLLGKRVYGSDAGAGMAPVLAWAPDILRVYDGLHAISRFAAHAFSTAPVPVHVIPGPVDETAFAPSGTARDPALAVGLGRVLPHKGYERTIAALPPGMRLVIVGQHYDPEYLAFLRECAAGRDVAFEPGLDDAAVCALLHRAGVMVHASTHRDYRGRNWDKPELLGLAPLEALCCGLPCLVSDAGSLPELAVLPGCRVFADDAELASLLAAPDPAPPAAAMHAAVARGFGLHAVGTALLAMMEPACGS